MTFATVFWVCHLLQAIPTERYTVYNRSDCYYLKEMTGARAVSDDEYDTSPNGGMRYESTCGKRPQENCPTFRR